MKRKNKIKTGWIHIGLYLLASYINWATLSLFNLDTIITLIILFQLMIGMWIGQESILLNLAYKEKKNRFENLEKPKGQWDR